MGYTQKSAKKVIDLLRRSLHFVKPVIGLKTNIRKGMRKMVKVGDTVTVQMTGMVTGRYSDGSMSINNATSVYAYVFPEHIVTSTTREPWEVLNEAADILSALHPQCSIAFALRVEADSLEAAARPKPLPTLAEAVREMLAAFSEGVDWDDEKRTTYTAAHEALARAEAEAGR